VVTLRNILLLNTTESIYSMLLLTTDNNFNLICKKAMHLWKPDKKAGGNVKYVFKICYFFEV